MRKLLLGVLLSASFALAQDSKPAAQAPDNSQQTKNQVTIRGCVTRSNGDFTLIQQDPGVTYELHGRGKVKLQPYLGQRVEVTGQKSPSLSTSSDSDTKSASPVTITVTSIKTIDKECPLR